MESEQQVWVYILKGANGKHYTGITNDIARRMKEHMAGGCKSTKRYGLLTIEWMYLARNRKEARELEVLIKKKGARQFMKTYGQGPLERSEKKEGIKIKGERRTVSIELKNEYGKGFMVVGREKEEKEEKEKRKESQA